MVHAEKRWYDRVMDLLDLAVVVLVIATVLWGKAWTRRTKNDGYELVTASQTYRGAQRAWRPGPSSRRVPSSRGNPRREVTGGRGARTRTPGA